MTVSASPSALLSSLVSSKLGLFVFFAFVFTVLYAVTYAVILGVRENYLRYAQKADLQWTGSESKRPPKRISVPLILALAILTSWLVVEFLILSS